MQVGDLVIERWTGSEHGRGYLGIVVEREPAPEEGDFADAIIVREYNGRITRWGEAWLEVVSGASN